MCICESWLGTEITDNEISIDGYKIIRLDRSRHGGGVALYISNNLSHKVIFSGNSCFECVIVSIQFGYCKVCVCLLYRPPNSNNDFFDSLYDILCTLDISLFSNFLLLGDFNVDFFYLNPIPFFQNYLVLHLVFYFTRL